MPSPHLTDDDLLDLLSKAFPVEELAPTESGLRRLAADVAKLNASSRWRRWLPSWGWRRPAAVTGVVVGTFLAGGGISYAFGLHAPFRSMASSVSPPVVVPAPRTTDTTDSPRPPRRQLPAPRRLLRARHGTPCRPSRRTEPGSRPVRPRPPRRAGPAVEHSGRGFLGAGNHRPWPRRERPHLHPGRERARHRVERGQRGHRGHGPADRRGCVGRDPTHRDRRVDPHHQRQRVRGDHDGARSDRRRCDRERIDRDPARPSARRTAIPRRQRQRQRPRPRPRPRPRRPRPPRRRPSRAPKRPLRPLPAAPPGVLRRPPPPAPRRPGARLPCRQWGRPGPPAGRTRQHRPPAPARR